MNAVATVLTDHILGLAHIGYIVEDLTSALANFQRVYGVSEKDIVVQPPFDQAAPSRFAFVTIKDSDVELIEPISDYFKALLLTMPSGGAGINHVAYRVDNIDAAVALLAFHLHYPWST